MLLQLQSARKIRKVASSRWPFDKIVCVGVSGGFEPFKYVDGDKVTQTIRGFARTGAKAIIALTLLAGLQGCGMSQLMSGFGSGVFGGDSSAPKDTRAITEEQLLSAAKSDSGGAMGGMLVAHGCPKFIIWPRDRLLTVYDYKTGSQGDAFAVVHRGEITKTARECRIENGRVIIKYGFAGQVLLGPKGKSGQINLPVKVYVTDSAREKINTEKVKVSVNVAPDKRIGYFSVVRSIAFPVPEGARPGDYKLFIAFDRIKSQS